MSVRAEQKERSHREILASAARLFRIRGIAGTSVGDVMRGAGLTVGGFYAHFGSKEALVEESLRAAMVQMRAVLHGWAAKAPEGERLVRILQGYLSRTHRDAPEEGCLLPAVVSELATDGEALRPALAEELRTWASAIDELDARPRDVPRGQRALGMIALMFGGLALARAVRGTPLSDEILRACRAYGRAALRGFEAHADASSAARPKEK